MARTKPEQITSNNTMKIIHTPEGSLKVTRVTFCNSIGPSSQLEYSRRLVRRIPARPVRRHDVSRNSRGISSGSHSLANERTAPARRSDGMHRRRLLTMSILEPLSSCSGR